MSLGCGLCAKVPIPPGVTAPCQCAWAPKRPMFVWQVILDLEEERQRHAQDTAEGDDVTYMLEKERERLTQQVRVRSW